MRQQSLDVIDFDTGNSKPDTAGVMRRCQEQLKRLKNPYVGNKRGIIVDIAQALDENDVQYSSVLDLFAGSGVVSLFMKLYGKRVISNDLLMSSYFNAVALVVNDSVTIDQDVLDKLGRPNADAVPFVRERFSTRFTVDEAAYLDSFRANVDVIAPEGSSDVLRAVCFVTLQNYVMDKCFLGGRLNHGQILAELKHRLQHQRNATTEESEDEMRFALKPLPLFKNNGHEHKAINGDACDTLASLDPSNLPDLCYLDPPYGGQQSDYANMFRFVEEFVHGKPLEEVSLYQKSRNFTTAKDFEAHFREVLERTRLIKTIAVSFNDSSWADVDKVKGIMGDYKNHVVAVGISHKYKYRAKKAAAVEYLLIAR
jgi:DNA adenine methylase